MCLSAHFDPTFKSKFRKNFKITIIYSRRVCSKNTKFISSGLQLKVERVFVITSEQLQLLWKEKMSASRNNLAPFGTQCIKLGRPRPEQYPSHAAVRTCVVRQFRGASSGLEVHTSLIVLFGTKQQLCNW